MSIVVRIWKKARLENIWLSRNFEKSTNLVRSETFLDVSQIWTLGFFWLFTWSWSLVEALFWWKFHFLEKSSSGVIILLIPNLLISVPFFQNWLRKEQNKIWVGFLLVYMQLVIGSGNIMVKNTCKKKILISRNFEKLAQNG